MKFTPRLLGLMPRAIRQTVATPYNHEKTETVS